MQKVANLETVSRACMQLRDEGQKITGRAVVSITGGSLGTVLSLIKDWKQEADKVPLTQPEEIPAELQAAMIRSLGFAQDKATEILKEKIEEASAREVEALEGLAEAERQISDLTGQVAEIRGQAVEKDQAADKAAAVSTEKIESMEIRVQILETERRQLIESAEASRTEAAKALMQVERADQATTKAESRMETLETELIECSTGKVEAEKVAAVAEQRSSDLVEQLAETRATTEQRAAYLTEQLAETRTTLAETKSEGKTLSAQRREEVKELRETNKDLEIKNAGLVAIAEAAKKKEIPVASSVEKDYK